MNYFRRKLANFKEHLHPDYLASLARGDSAAQRKKIRQGHRPQPGPHSLKQSVIRSYGRAHQSRILIETGTFRGDMLLAMLHDFDRLYSIELGHDLWCAAVERFAAQPHVKIFEGNSSQILPDLLKGISEPVTFWLDAHSSGFDTAKGQLETAIEGELACIVTHPVKNHVILIDDAREFGVGKHYPTIKQVEKIVSGTYRAFEVKDDIIRITN